MEEQHHSTCQEKDPQLYKNGCIQSNVKDQYFPVDIDLDVAHKNQPASLIDCTRYSTNTNGDQPKPMDEKKSSEKITTQPGNWLQSSGFSPFHSYHQSTDSSWCCFYCCFNSHYYNESVSNQNVCIDNCCECRCCDEHESCDGSCLAGCFEFCCLCCLACA